jgi:ABC-type enterochelin transport system ATPase subunit
VRTSEPCLCGDTDCPRCYPSFYKNPEVSDADRDGAIKQIIDDLFAYGRYPENGRIEFDLSDFLADQWGEQDLARFAVTVFGGNNERIIDAIAMMRERAEIILRRELEDLDITDELAQEIANDRGQE